jgi:aminopeptidase-like protein
MRALNAELFPICRSIAGDCPRRTMEVQQRRVALEVHSVNLDISSKVAATTEVSGKTAPQ